MKGFMQEVEEIIRKAGEGVVEEEEEEGEGVDGMEIDQISRPEQGGSANGKKERKLKSRKPLRTSEPSTVFTKSKPAAQVKVRKGLTEADLIIPAVEYQSVEKAVKPKKKKNKKKDTGDFGEGDGLEDVDYEDKVERKRSLQFHVTRVDQVGFDVRRLSFFCMLERTGN